jgi:DNA polymerase III epsilon subunit family exonuclease
LEDALAQWPEKWIDLPLAVIDVETTGFDPEDERIIEIGIIRFENGEVIESYGQLIDPGKPVPEKVTEITGIKDEDLKGMPAFADVAEEVWRRLQNVGIVAYNLSFDRNFVTAELERHGYEWPEEAPTLDPLIFARQFFKSSSRKNLGAISKLLGIPLEEAHRATHDAKVAGQVLYAFESRLPERLEDLMVLQAQWEAEQAREMSHWKGDFTLGTSSTASRPIGLGPAYIYGDEADPMRALYSSIPEAPERQPN